MAKNDPKTHLRIAHSLGATDQAPPLDLGIRVRELRRERDWTL